MQLARRLVTMGAAAALLVACGYNDGNLTTWSPGDKHQFRMDLSGVRYMRTVSGEASIGSIFCWGGPFPGYAHGIPLDHGLYKQAMQALQEDAKLQPNEILKDLRTDHDPACYLFLYGVNTLTLSADVYEVRPAGAPSTSGPPRAARVADSAPAVAVHPAGKLAYAQLQEAFAQVQAVTGEGSASHHDVAARILGGGPHRTDADGEYWFGTLPGKSDCFALKLSATKGDSLDTAPADKCK